MVGRTLLVVLSVLGVEADRLDPSGKRLAKNPVAEGGGEYGIALRSSGVERGGEQRRPGGALRVVRCPWARSSSQSTSSELSKARVPQLMGT